MLKGPRENTGKRNVEIEIDSIYKCMRLGIASSACLHHILNRP